MKLLVVGAGSIAREVTLAIAASRRSRPLAIKVVSRDLRRAEWLSLLGNSKARLFGYDVSYSAGQIDWETPECLAGVIAEFDPDVLLHTASFQSRWSLDDGGAWGRMVSAGGYGLTIALQAALHSQAWDAIQLSGRSPVFVNACYPDLVNAVGAAVGVRTFCGIGNIAILAEYFSLQLNAPRDRLRILAGHIDVELGALDGGARPVCPRVWIDGLEVDPDRLKRIPPLVNDVTLNTFNAAISSGTIASLLERRPLPLVHLPGADGMIGGAPMSFDGKALQLALPSAISASEALSWNLSRAEMDGAYLEDMDRVVFSPKAQRVLSPVSAELAKGFRIADLMDAARAFIDLRTNLSA